MLKDRAKQGRAGFTLMELLVVIAIIGLVSGMLLTALTSARTSAKKTRARAELDQIETAWKSYLQEYHRFPTQPITEMGQTAIEILRGENATENPQGIIFMDFRQGLSGVSFVDPWDQVYHVALDTDGDNYVEVRGERLPVLVAAWSNGPDEAAGTKDDLVSWE